MKKSLLLFFILIIASCGGTTTPADSTTGDTATEQDSQDVKDRQPTVVEGNFRLILGVARPRTNKRRRLR